jgi:hypothetical protein
MTFNPDGRSLLCGLHESLKVVLLFPQVIMSRLLLVPYDF